MLFLTVILVKILTLGSQAELGLKTFDAQSVEARFLLMLLASALRNHAEHQIPLLKQLLLPHIEYVLDATREEALHGNP